MFIKVKYHTASSSYAISKILSKLKDYPTLSFDTETRGVYTKAERAEAVQYLKHATEESKYTVLARQVANNSGLSHPELIGVTHFILGVSKEESYILLPSSSHEEMIIWRFLKTYEGTLLVHNASFDLKIMYHRVRAFPKTFLDTSISAKCFINHVDVWKAKVGLKELMCSYYDPEWGLMEDYEPENLKDPKFLNYAAIDGAATYYLYELTLEMENDYKIRNTSTETIENG